MKREKKQSDPRANHCKKTDGTSKDQLAFLLKAEEEAEAPWILSQIERYFGRKVKVLDMSAGAGFLANHLAYFGHSVTGCGLTSELLKTAKEGDKTGSVHYHLGDAAPLCFSSKSFEVVLAMHVFEGSEEAEKIIQEASRLLTHRGLFFFHTFNRTPLSYLLFKWIHLTPKGENAHILMLKPDEMASLCDKNFLMVKRYYGLRPEINLRVLLKLIAKRRVPKELRFTLTPHLLSSYGGVAVKEDMRVKSLSSSYSDSALFVREGI